MKWLKTLFASQLLLIPCVAFALGIFRWPEVDRTIQWILMIYLFMVVSRTLFFFFGMFRERLQAWRISNLTRDSFAQPMVSIIVPCYNEQDVIAKSLTQLLHLNYPFYEVIVIDDGSSDATAGMAQSIASQSDRVAVHVLTQVNQGKAAALNNGILHASGDLILCVDADSRILPDSLQKGARHFIDPEVGAVAGFVEISNQNNLLTQLQQLEYLTGMNFTRRAMSFLGIVPIVPGPAGMFRRSAILEAGGLTSAEIFAEDAELSLRILANGWVIRAEEEMVAVTEAPEDIMSLLRQRYRWNRGALQALLMNLRQLLFKARFRGLSVGMYLFMESTITPFLNISLIFYFMGHFLTTGEVQMFTIWYAYLLILDLLTTILVTHKHGRITKWIWLTIVNKVGYYYMLLTWRIFGLFDEVRQSKMSWDKLDRTGNL